MPFQLPPNITAQRKPLSPTSYEYVLRHSELGQLGRIFLTAGASGECKVTYQVYGRPDDHMTAQRQAIFEPLAVILAEQIQQTVKLAAAA